MAARPSRKSVAAAAGSAPCAWTEAAAVSAAITNARLTCRRIDPQCCRPSNISTSVFAGGRRRGNGLVVGPGSRVAAGGTLARAVGKGGVEVVGASPASGDDTGGAEVVEVIPPAEATGAE